MKKMLLATLVIGSTAYSINQQQFEEMQKNFREQNNKSAATALLCEMGSGINTFASIALIISNRVKFGAVCAGGAKILHYLAKLSHDSIRERNRIINNILILELTKNKDTSPHQSKSITEG